MEDHLPLVTIEIGPPPMESAAGPLLRSHSESDAQAPPPSSSAGSAPDHTRRSLQKTASFPVRLGGAGNQVKKFWKTAALKTRDLPDPWAGVLDEIPPEGATRHMYNPRTRMWKTDEVVVKIQSKPFAHGAMRECFRMKKLSKFSHNPDWRNASNYVAKRYMKEVAREVYFEDIKLQMDSKLWGEEYSKHNPPKKVDFFQTYIIELVGREGSPLYCVEHLIDGKYIKYNSNSGFVSEVNRLTPQAFSHFTFERSNHRLIVVDIQGVGDLYTDPQIHTTDETGYGEANLGTRGVALFFSSHLCNPLCHLLGLTQFDLSEKELEHLRSRRWHFSTPSTALPLSKSEPTMATRGEDGRLKGETVGEVFRRLSLSINIQPPTDPGSSSSSSLLPPESPLDSPGITMIATPGMGLDSLPSLREDAEEEEGEGVTGDGCDGGSDATGDEGGTQVRSDDVSWRNSDVIPKIVAPMDLVVAEEGTKSASVEKEVTRLREEEEQEDTSGGKGRGKGEREGLRILGMVHFDLATCHEMGRFSEDQTPDLESALFHLRKAASCGNTQALCTLAHIHLQLPHQEFEGISVEATPTNEHIGMEYLIQAAEGGVAVAMMRVAKAYETGEGLGKAAEGDPNFSATQRHQDWKEAARWYSQALQTATDEQSETQTPEQAIDPNYTILAKLAELHRTGGHGLERDSQKAGDLYTQAAEAAMASMKGKLANKFYMLAEEAWAEAPDEI